MLGVIMAYRAFGGFILDSMLGKLARWLRILRFDAVYWKKGLDECLIKRTIEENRVLITRNRALVKRKAPFLFYLIREDKLSDQLLEIVPLLKFLKSSSKKAGICTVCNALLQETPKDAVVGQIPAFVFNTIDVFYCCPACQRIYWEASHLKLMRDFLGKNHELLLL